MSCVARGSWDEEKEAVIENNALIQPCPWQSLDARPATTGVWEKEEWGKNLPFSMKFPRISHAGLMAGKVRPPGAGLAEA